MAILTASVSGRTVNWQITGLGYPFDTRQYMSAGICMTSFTDGAASISNILDTVYPVTYSSGSSPVYGEKYVSTNYYPAQSINGYSSYNFDSSTGQFSNAGILQHYNIGDYGTFYIASGSTLSDCMLSPSSLMIDLYTSYLISSGSPAVIGPYNIGDSFADAPVGKYYIYGWARIQVNGLYYNAGVYEITVLGDGTVKLDTSSGWVNAVPYIDTPSGWVIPEVWIDTPSGWVKASN